jgi:archaeal flagellar protein FlaJ
MIDDIKKNIDSEISILREISNHNIRLDYAGPYEQKLLTKTIVSLRESMRIINDSIPSLLSEITLAKKLPSRKELRKQKKFEEITYKRGGTEFKVAIATKDRERLLKELSISESNVKKLKRGEEKFDQEYKEFKAARGYLKFSNKMFLDSATRWINRGKFKKLSVELRKANIDVLFHAYVAMIFMTTLLALIFGFFLMLLLMFFTVGLSSPYVMLFDGSYLFRFLQIFWIPIVIPIFTFALLYYYPTTEKKTLAKQINQELPFAVIHMSAISGSGIQPSEIFRIIGLNREYPYLRKEIRKVLNQMNLYGYDLITALNNTASSTPSVKLAELFSGLATTITSGGEFSEFFEKRAESLLSSYRLERQKYAKTAETFMDIYISVIIAAPMILMLFLIMLTVGSFDIGFTTPQLTFLIIAVIAIINVFFLIFLHLNQPSY